MINLKLDLKGTIQENELSISKMADYLNELAEEWEEEGNLLDDITVEKFKIEDLPGYDYVELDFEDVKDIVIALDNSALDLDNIHAYIEAFGSSYLMEAIELEGNGDLYLNKNMGMADVAREYIAAAYEIPEEMENYIDYERFGEDMRKEGQYYEVSAGILEIRG